MKTNENKKSNKKLLVVAGMAALLALVGYMGGTTFAKYVTEQSVDTETAVVAKWGYVVQIQSDGLFGDAYDGDVVAYASGVEVKADTEGKNVLAPGTQGEFKIKVDGQAEVMSNIKVEAVSTKDVFLKTASEEYHPIVWTITANSAKVGDEDVLDGIDLTDITTAQMVAALNELNCKNIAPNTKVAYDLEVSWSWAFENGKDVQDTMLGDLVALSAAKLEEKYGAGNVPASTDYCTSIDFGVSVSIEQQEATIA